MDWCCVDPSFHARVGTQLSNFDQNGLARRARNYSCGVSFSLSDNSFDLGGASISRLGNSFQLLASVQKPYP
jgi:hypothetical protein